MSAANVWKVRARTLDKLRAKNYDGSTEEWTSILKYGLVSKQSDIDQALKDNLEISCSTSGKDPKSTLSIAFRTRVQDITQRLGSIELPQTTDTDDVDLFGWVTQLADKRDQLESEAARQETKAGAEAETIVALQKQLDELIKAKTSHEEELVSKFAQLLNEKKHQLRKLHRVLETARVDPKKLKELEQSASTGTKRGKKRSARQTPQADESEDSEGFDNMDLDKPGAQVSDDEDGRAQQTTDSNDAETDGEEDNSDQPVMSQTEAGSNGPSKSPPKGKAPAHMPTARELPFGKQGKQTEKVKKKMPSPKAKAPTDEDEETASEDDEL